jgi:hypothetical protein
MPRRIEVELTSKVDDDTWTWRAAGARQPKGTLAAKLLYDGAKVGDIARAEVENDIDAGILVLSITPPKGKTPETGRLEIFAPPEKRIEQPTYTDRPERGGRPGGGRDRSDRPDSGRPRRGGEGDRGPRRTGEGAPGRGERSPGRDTGGRSGERSPGRDGASRSPGRDGGGRSGDRDSAGRSGDRSSRPRADARPPRGPRPQPEPASERPKHKKLNPGHTHRTAVLEALAPEQRAIAEHVLRGGIPAVRQAIDTQNAALKAEDKPAIKPEPLIALAEDLLPSLKAAEWRDRAEAATAAGDELSVRDLRSVVTGADAARDDDSRLLARTLRETLDRRLTEDRETWVTDITEALTAGRVVRALRIAARPPDPATRFPAELGTRLSEAAGAALASDVPPERWLAVLDAVAVSPVRRAVKPAGLPPEPPAEFLATLRSAVIRVPALGPLIGVAPPKLPPPPKPLRRRPPGAAAPTGDGPTGATPPPDVPPPEPAAEETTAAAAAAPDPSPVAAPVGAPDPSPSDDPADPGVPPADAAADDATGETAAEPAAEPVEEPANRTEEPVASADT